jgi:hypothetical protein
MISPGSGYADAVNRSPAWIWGGLAALMGVYAWNAWRFGDWLVDDAGITFAYARHFAAGEALSVNAGEAPVEGYSNPTWTLLCALLYAAGLFTLPLSPKVFSVVCVWAAMVVAVRLAVDAFARPASPTNLLGPALMAGIPGFVQWSISGLENPLYALLILSTTWAHVRAIQGRGAPETVGGLAFLVAATRPEGLAYGAALGVLFAARVRELRPVVRWLAAFVLPATLYGAWHLATFEDLLPNTYYAKLGEDALAGPSRRLQGGLRYLGLGLQNDLLPAFGALGLVTVLDARGVWARGGEAVGVALATSMAAVVNLGGDWMGAYRFLTPTYALLGVWAGGGAAAMSARYGERLGTGVGAALALGFALSVPTDLATYRRKAGMRLLVQLQVLDPMKRPPWSLTPGRPCSGGAWAPRRSRCRQQRSPGTTPRGRRWGKRR